MIDVRSEGVEVVIEYPAGAEKRLSHMEALELSNMLDDPYRIDIVVAANEAKWLYDMRNKYY
ncbi:hypothetical protein [Natrarchaeobaculum sulfurireducens]|uniref:hypothetical protein n=1 Tax=Natrarchaeobaculum sulfurireducens TaxID=2044521 RepID=UPI00105AB0D1|nr:hypothetical protein [Natrarchaeobaculum sulfurireducens]